MSAEPKARDALTAALALGLLAPGLSLAPAPTRAEVYRQVEVSGTRHIPSDDVAETCGPLTEVELITDDLKAVEDCLLYTGVFDAVKVSAKGDVLHINVVEIETRPGRIDVGIAYLSDQGVTGTLDYEQFNLIPDTYLSISNSYHRENKSYEISLLRQDIWPQKLHFGIDLAGQRTAFDDRNYESRVDQFEFFMGKIFANGLRADLGFGYRDQRMFGLSESASTVLQAEAGTIHAAFAHAALSYQFPTKSEDHNASVLFDAYVWNLGTDTTLLDLRLEANGHIALSDRYDLHLGLRAGSVSAQGDQPPRLLDRAFLGGESLRGFAPRGLGPTMGTDRLGGEHYAMASLELRREMGAWGDNQIEAGIFTDFGSVWSLSTPQAAAVDDHAHLRASFGVSVNMTLGGFPLQAYLAKAITREARDETQVFGLSVTTQF